MKPAFWILAAALTGGSGVVLGAATSHGGASASGISLFLETAVSYQVYHVAALVAVAWLAGRENGSGKLIDLAGWLFVAGIILFSGSLYYLGWTGVPFAPYITPIGGLSLIAGWVLLAISALRAIKE